MGIIINVFVIFLILCQVAISAHTDLLYLDEPVATQNDTIIEEAATITMSGSESFYGTPHNLPMSNQHMPFPIERYEGSDWMLWFLLAGLVVLSIAWFNFPVQFKRNLYAVLGLRFFFQIDKDVGFFKGAHNYLLFTNFLIVLSLLTYQSLYHAEMLKMWRDTNQEYVFLAILIMFLSFFILKFLFINFIAWVFNTQRAGSIYLGNIFVFNNFLGLILMPIVFHNAFNQSFTIIYVMWSLVIMANVFKVIRGSIIAHQASGFSPYYLFLYLCGVELLPLLVVWRAATSYLSVF